MKSFSKWMLVLPFLLLFLNDGFAQKITLGQKHRGGIVFYIDSSGKHGLIAALKDQGMTGRENDISYAKRMCSWYTTTVKNTTYHTWYLPSLDELQLLYKQKDLVGSFKGWFYWSSTFNEHSGGYMKLNFSNGQQGSGNMPTYIRAIQSF